MQEKYQEGQLGNNSAAPDQVRQIGSLDEGLRIYMEDYVYTYLKQLSRGDREHLAVLIGRRLLLDGVDALCISGAIQALHTETQNGMECFTEKSWEAIDSDMEKIFPGLELVGWMHSQPGFGTFLAARDETYHRIHFPGPYQVLFLRDALEDQDAFYVPDPNTGYLRAALGYFLYYDCNPEMQSYLVDGTEDKRAEPTPPRPDADKKIRFLLHKKQSGRLESRYTFLAALSGVLCLACLAMATGLYSSQGKLKELESQVAIAQSLAQEALNGTEAAFAAQAEDKQAPEAGTAPETQPSSETGASLAANATQPSTSLEGTKPETATVFYTVQQGDTLTRISWRFYNNGERVQDIMALNGITDPDTIFYGRQIQLPNP